MSSSKLLCCVFLIKHHPSTTMNNELKPLAHTMRRVINNVAVKDFNFVAQDQELMVEAIANDNWDFRDEHHCHHCFKPLIVWNKGIQVCECPDNTKTLPYQEETYDLVEEWAEGEDFSFYQS